MDYLEILTRLGIAALAGGAIGLNRDLHGKPTGIRTLGIVSLASALIVVASMNFDFAEAPDRNAVSRVVQGVITGIGFLGAGVIFRQQDTHKVEGMTTAACIWLTAAIGIICGIAAYRLLLVGLPVVFVVLILGGPLERVIHRWWDSWDKGGTWR
jgi:putative Mg2+ transporter-C (MgtC) family protein